MKSEEKRAQKVVGIAIRKVSPDGKALTITDEGTNRKGMKFSQLLVSTGSDRGGLGDLAELSA